MVVLDSEIGNAMTISALKWKRVTGFGENNTNLQDFKIYMGYSSLDVLGTNFNNNFIPGTRTLVYSRDPLVITGVAPETWFTSTLDTPFFYNGTNNLLVEIEWSTGSNSIYIYHWDAVLGRSVVSQTYGTPTGDLDVIVPHLILSGTLDLESSTFGSIKSMTI